jgi:AAA+ ATPase superfamily predicted ATPase
MGPEKALSSDSPYKFLAYYEDTDSAIFFGRERETEILLSDVISTRIVVLFARTGIGKTSLINAGVRPRLEELDYVTFYIRVEKDPEASLLRALQEAQAVPDDIQGQPLTAQLRQAVTRLGKPVVIFFDQFEEFFIYLVKPEDKEKARRFISQIAALYRDRESGVHTVFSMREEFFVEMDVFRDEIPSIFHNESSLRLRPLDAEQARRAIEQPAEKRGVLFDPVLTERLLVDLSDQDGIEPVRLQVICDSLWNQRTGNSITLGSYERLGGAYRILDKRLEDGIRSLSDANLHLLERLLPELCTSKGTKYTRGFDELVDRLGTDPATLGGLTERLKDLRLLRPLTRHQVVYVEWESDYLAARTNWLLRQVRSTEHRRLIQSAIKQAGADLSPDDDGSAALRLLASSAENGFGTMPLSRNEVLRLSGDPALLKLQSGEAALIFVSSLAYGADMPLWFEQAKRDGVSVWMCLREMVRTPDSYDEAAVNVVRLLGILGTQEATDLLVAALAQPALMDTAFTVLGDMRNDVAVEILAKAAQEETTSSQAVGVLRRMGMGQAVDALASIVRRGGASALRAGLALSVISSARGSRPIALRARAALTEALDEHASELLLTALQLGFETRFWFDLAREHGVDVWDILRASIVERDVPTKQSENAVRLLSELPDDQAESLLHVTAEQNRTARSATDMLSDRQRKYRAPAQSDLEPKPVRKLRPLAESDWARLLRSLQISRVIPVLGAQAEPPEIPRPEQIARHWISRYELPVPTSNVDDLAFASQALSVAQDPTFVKMSLSEELRSMREAGRQSFRELEDRSSLYGVVSELPFPIYITTSYDDQLVQALLAQGKSPQRDFPRWNDLIEPPDRPAGEEAEYQASVNEPLVFHLFGVLDEPESIVLTEDEYFQFLIRVSRQPIIPLQVRKALALGSQLLVGHRMRSLEFRTLLSLLTVDTRLRRSSHVLTLDPDDILLDWESERAEYVVEYLDKYFGEKNVSLYWGSTPSFAQDLYMHWKNLDSA